MNKKIKVIELFQKSANNEELPKKIYFDGDVFELDTEGVYKSNGTLLVDCLNYDLSNLNDYIKVLEDNTEEIEEKSNFEDMGYEIAQAYFEFYKGIAKALTEKRKESEDK